MFKSMKMRWAGYVARMGVEFRQVSLVNPEGKGQEGKPIYRFEGNIETDLSKIGWKLWTGFICLRR
jgi:hypothetical protein